MGCCASSDKHAQSGMERSGVNSCGNSARGESYRRGHSSRFSDVVSTRDELSHRSSRANSISESTGSSGAHDDHDVDLRTGKDDGVAAPALFELMQMHPNANPSAEEDEPADCRLPPKSGTSQGAIPLPSVGTCSPESAEKVDFARRSTGRRFDDGSSRTSRTSRSSGRVPGIQGGIVAPIGMDDSDTPWSQGTSASDRSNSEAGSLPGYNMGDFEDGDVNLRDIHRPAGGGSTSDARRSRSKHGPRVPRSHSSPATKASAFPEYPTHQR